MSDRLAIVVDGLDGSGKSTLTRRLLEALAAGGERAVAIRVDDFRRPVDWASGGSEAELYYERYYDLAACDACVRAFHAGERAIDVPVYDIAAERPTGARTLVFEGVTIAVIEGVFPLRMPSVRDTLRNTLLFLETSEAEARRRIIKRDLAKGRPEAEIVRRIEQRYFPTQARYRAEHAPRDHADVVIDNEHPAEPRGIKRDLGRLPPAVREILTRVLPPL